MSTTQEVTAEQIASALGWQRDGTTGWARSFPERQDGSVGEYRTVVPPYLEDSPEGYALLREFRAACKERGWKYGIDTAAVREDWDVCCTIYRDKPITEGTKAWAENEPRACWTAWYRAVQAQEG